MLQKIFFGLESNFWKYFMLILTGRRNYAPILSIYYLTLNNTTAYEIGIYTGAGYLGSLILGVPISYIADKIGHKKIIVLTKIFVLISTILYIFGDNFYYFLVAAVFMTLGTSEGVIPAFFHDTLLNLKRGHEYKKISSSYKAYVSLVSMFIIIGLPFLTTINIKLPFIITLFIDIIGLIVAILLVVPKKEHKLEQTNKNIFGIFKENRKNGLYPVLIFSAIIGGFLMADQAYRGPFLQSLGYPVIYIGFVMGLSRFVWFIVGKNVEFLEKYLSFKKMLLLEIFIFSLYYIMSYFIDNPYIVGLIFSLVIGYMWGRNEIYNDYFFSNIHDKNYKSTILSFKRFLSDTLQIVLGVSIGFIMNFSYKLGFLILGIILFVSLTITYLFIKE